jgi:hypothetical protein
MTDERSDRSAAEARLAELARKHAIEWEPLLQDLVNARDEQSRLEELAEGHSCEAAGWESVIDDLDARHTRTLEAVDRVMAELMEVDAAFLTRFPAEECQEMLREMRSAFERALTVRAESARFILSLAYAARQPEYPDGAIVTAALERILTRLSEGKQGTGINKNVALALTAALAQVGDVLPDDLQDPIAALQTRLEGVSPKGTDLKALFHSRESVADARLEPGMPFEEIARRAQAIALGLWPDEP